MRKMGSILGMALAMTMSTAQSTSHSDRWGKTPGKRKVRGEAIDGSKPTKRRMKVKLARKANLKNRKR